MKLFLSTKMVVLLVGDKRAVIPYDKAVKSELLQFVMEVQGRDASYNVPERYHSIIGNYINYLHDRPTAITSVNKLVNCLELAAKFGDYSYGKYVVEQCYDRWDEVISIVSTMTDDHVKSRIEWYLYSLAPLNFVPDKLLTDREFIKQWLGNNDDQAKKEIVLNHHDVYHIVIESRFYPQDHITCFISDGEQYTDSVEILQVQYHVGSVNREHYVDNPSTGQRDFIRTLRVGGLVDRSEQRPATSIIDLKVYIPNGARMVRSLVSTSMTTGR